MESTDVLEIERLAGAARDALTDEMVGRLSATAADGVDLLDQINRSGVARALPALAQLVSNGDLDRLVALARTYGAAQDAMTDEMVSRMADTLGASLSMADRLHRAGLDRLIGVLERLASGGALDRLDELVERLDAGMGLLERTVGALEAVKDDNAAKATTAGGFGGLWTLLRNAENQETLRFLLAFGREFRRERPVHG